MKTKNIGKLLALFGAFAALSSATTISLVRPGACGPGNPNCFEYTLVGDGIGAAGLDDYLPSFALNVDGNLVGLAVSVATVGDSDIIAWGGKGKIVNPKKGQDYLDFTFNGFSDPDPMLLWTFAASSGTVAKTVSMTFIQPIFGGPFVRANADYSGSATLTKKGNINGIVQDNFLDGVSAIKFSNNCLPADGGPGSPVCTPGSGTKKLTPPSLITELKSSIEFTLAAGSGATFNGRLEVLPVPEPGTVALMGFGLLLLSAAGRRISAKKR